MRRILALMVLAAAVPAAARMELGVNTHFEQGWPVAALSKVRDSGAQGIRDSVTWGKVEQQPGRHAFTAKNSGHVDVACKRSIPVLLVIAPRNKLYDGGMAVASAVGQRALARYVGALVDRFPCVIGIEIGNEINTPSRKWPRPADKPRMYVAMLKAVRFELDRHPRKVALLGGSSVGVAVDFHERLFAAGELPLIDAIAIHPYVDNPDRLPDQLARLRQAIARRGQSKAIWATEFGNYYKTPAAAPPHALKIITILSAARVDRAFWYALLDERWYPNMGLYAGAAPKPALKTFRLAVERLLPAGNARRIDAGDQTSFVYRFGDGYYVMWGQGRSIRVPAGARVFDASGEPIDIPKRLGPDPIIVRSAAGIGLG